MHYGLDILLLNIYFKDVYVHTKKCTQIFQLYLKSLQLKTTKLYNRWAGETSMEYLVLYNEKLCKKEGQLTY